MFNEVTIKKFIKKIAVVSFIATVQSCGNTNESAINLFNQAQALYEVGEYDKSILLLDSLKKNHTDDIDLLKKGLHLRTLNQEKQIKAEIAQNDSLIAVLENENIAYNGKFQYIKHKDMVEGFYVHKSIAKDVDKTEKTIIEPRIDENDMFYLVSYLTGHDIKHTSVKLASNNSTVVSSSVPYDKAQNYRYNSGGTMYEIVTFNNNQCDTLGYFVSKNENSIIKVIYQGKKSYATQLNSKYIKAIAETYRYATNKLKGKAAIKKRMFLVRKLELAQKQIEQTKIPDSQ